MIQQNNRTSPSYSKIQRTVIGHFLLKTELPLRPENRKHMPQHLKSTWIDPGWELALRSSNYQEAQTLTALKVQAAGGSGWVVKHTGENRPVLDLGYKLHQLRLLLKHDSLEHQVSSQAIVWAAYLSLTAVEPISSEVQQKAWHAQAHPFSRVINTQWVFSTKTDRSSPCSDFTPLGA